MRFSGLDCQGKEKNVWLSTRLAVKLWAQVSLSQHSLHLCLGMTWILPCASPRSESRWKPRSPGGRVHPLCPLSVIWGQTWPGWGHSAPALLLPPQGVGQRALPLLVCFARLGLLPVSCDFLQDSFLVLCCPHHQGYCPALRSCPWTLSLYSLHCDASLSWFFKNTFWSFPPTKYSNEFLENRLVYGHYVQGRWWVWCLGLVLWSLGSPMLWRRE